MDGTTIPAGGYLRLVADDTFAFGLSKEDAVILKEPDGETVDVSDWEEGDAPEGASWARIPDKTGAFETTNQITPNAANLGSIAGPSCGDLNCDDSEDCETCEADCGACPVPVVVVLNEIVAKAADGGDDWVELYNAGTSAADISGWTIEDDGGATYTFPNPTNLAPSGYLFVNQTEFGFGLGKADAVTLKDAEGIVVDLADWEDGDASEGTSWARVPNGSGEFQTTAQLTPNAENVLMVPIACGDAVCDQSEDCDSCADDCGACAGCPTDLFISEYVEGSGDNKAIEIFNGTGTGVDLELYEIWSVINGGVFPESFTPLSGTLAPGEVLVLCNDGFDLAFIGVCDLTYSANPVNFNGDDAIALAKKLGGVSEIIDQVGEDGDDPGNGWNVAGVSLATVNHTLVRKAPVIPSTTWAESAANEWLVYQQNVFEFLGSHVFSSSLCE